MSVSLDLVTAVQRLAPISLGELGAEKLMDRVDTKFVTREPVLVDLLDAVAGEYRVLEVDGFRCSPYTSEYFDSPKSSCYLEHHNGKGERYKFRTRQYVSSGISFFEVKHKTNKGRTIKQRVPIELTGPPLQDDSHALVDQVFGRPIDLVSQLHTSYTRITLVHQGSPERVTIDLDLEFSRNGESQSLPGVAIIEVKQARDSRNSPIRKYLRSQRVAPFRVSKYCIGRALLEPNLKQNQFKHKLRKLQSLTL